MNNVLTLTETTKLVGAELQLLKYSTNNLLLAAMELREFATLHRVVRFVFKIFSFFQVPKETKVSKCKRIINQSLSLPLRPLIATLAGSVVAIGIITGTTLKKDCIGRTYLSLLVSDGRCLTAFSEEGTV